MIAKPVAVDPHLARAIRLKLKMSNKDGVQHYIKWYNPRPGKTPRGWGIFKKE